MENNIPTVDIEAFSAIEMRAGTILTAVPNEKARVPAYCLTIDFGEWGIRQSSAQLTQLYTPETLIGRQIIAVTNLPPRRVAGFRSEVLVLGTNSPQGTVLLAVEQGVRNGDRVY